MFIEVQTEKHTVFLNMEKVFSFYWYKNLILICYDCNQTDDFTIAIPASDENTCILNNFLRRVNKCVKTYSKQNAP